MLHKNSLFKIFGLLLVVNCQFSIVNCSSHAEPADVAAHAAKQYYDYLLEGKYEAFVDGQYRPDSISDSFRQELVMNAKMFMGQQQREHRGLLETRIVNCDIDSTLHEASVFLAFCYGDSTTEQVCVPMVEADGVWFLR